jgi:decaprenyl-diphosphate synthase subunit 2
MFGYRSLLYNGRNNMQAWGLIVLLISKAAGHLNVEDMEEDKAAGVLHRQVILETIKLDLYNYGTLHL